MDTDEIVVFHMPDGTEVSNDPRWLAEKRMRQGQRDLSSTPYTGNEGVNDKVLQAQTRGDSVAAAPGQITGAMRQGADAAAAKAAGLSPSKPAVSAEFPDSNEKAGLAKPLGEMNGKELKAFAKANGIDISGITKKSEAVAKITQAMNPAPAPESDSLDEGDDGSDGSQSPGDE